MKVAIIGAGIVGSTAAYYLSKEAWEIEVLGSQSSTNPFYHI